MIILEEMPQLRGYRFCGESWVGAVCQHNPPWDARLPWQGPALGLELGLVLSPVNFPSLLLWVTREIQAKVLQEFTN